MENILDRSENYLTIFTKEFKIDKTLPKWSIIKSETKEIEKDDKEPISVSQFLNLSSADYNIYIGKKIAKNLVRNQPYSNFLIPSMDERIDTNNLKNNETTFKIVKRLYRTFIDKITGREEEEEVIEFDIFKFFEQVKLTSKDSQIKYVERIEPYMIALKQANELGQKALADKLTAEIFTNKYESILYSENFHFKITEEELVYFVKKTEKGIRLDYIENFVRPIPKQVAEMKKKADSLLVFDNYCILHYDPELKSFKQTKEQEEELRRKKSDPILFGMINGSRNLYYITDWIDEYCNLTLDEFIKVSGISKEHLKINEKISL